MASEGHTNIISVNVALSSFLKIDQFSKFVQSLIQVRTTIEKAEHIFGSYLLHLIVRRITFNCKITS